MPSKPRKGRKGIYVELPEPLLDELKKFAEGRGEAIREVIELAIRRHMAFPPAVPPPPLPPPPLPPLPDSGVGPMPPQKKSRKK